jgi:probable HAF family extracellular repeat protein
MIRPNTLIILLANLFLFMLLTKLPWSHAQGSLASSSYTVNDVSAGVTSRGRGPNISGDVVGRSGPLHTRGVPFVRNSGAGPEALVQLQGKGAVATGINNSGDIVGYANGVKSMHAFLLEKGVFQNLGALSTDTASQAFGVNNRGQVVGASYGASGQERSHSRPFLWNKGTGMQDLGGLPGKQNGRALAINETGAVVGSSGTFRDRHAFLWTPGTPMQDLGVLPGDTTSEATGINNRSEVVGFSVGPAGERAFLWTKQEGMKSLGTLPGGTTSRAVAINERGLVVGSSQTSHPITRFVGPRAFIWRPNVGIQDLNDLIPSGANVVLMEAVGINARGQIAVLGRNSRSGPLGHHEGPDRLFLLTPSP